MLCTFAYLGYLGIQDEIKRINLALGDKFVYIGIAFPIKRKHK
jgi:hypothetical protein